jgi:hypothetical protein
MSGPYLESGESIVLTTDRVSIDNVVYEAMLTTRQLILIDSLHVRFEPSTIPLTAIQSVRSGKAATGEPVVIVTLQGTEEGVAGSRFIIFLQEPLENRKHDRDLWVKKLIELSLSGRVTRGATEELPAEREGGMRPSVRRWTAPEITRPRPDNFPVQDASRDVIVTMDDPAPGTIPEIFPTIPMVAQTPEKPGNENGPELSWEADTEEAEDGPENFGSVATEPEDLEVNRLDLHDSGDGEQTTAPAEPVDHEPSLFAPPHANSEDAAGSLTASILAAVQSLTGRREQPRTIAPGAGIADGEKEDTPVTPVRRTSLLPEDMDEFPVAEYHEEPATVPTRDPPVIQERLPVFDEIERIVRAPSHLPESLTELPTEEVPATTPVTKVPDRSEPESLTELPTEEVPATTPVTEVPDRSEPESLTELPTEEVPATTPVTEVPVLSEPEVQRLLSEYSPDETVQKLSVGEEKQVPVRGPEEPAPAGSSSAHPLTGPAGIHPLLIAGGAILILLLVIAAILVLPGLHPQSFQPVTVAPVSIPATTTMPTPTITTGVIPDMTPTAIPVISPATVPHDGVWVRIVSAAYYTGQAGNPGYMEPVSGPGEKFVRMFHSNGLVQVSVAKQEYVKEELLVEIYSNGTLVASRSTTTPMGTVDLLIDPTTGNPPGIATPTPLKTNTTKTGTLEYF